MWSVQAARFARVFGLLLATQIAWAAPAIYTCTNASGKRLTSDRPIVDCLDRDQRVLNADGSVRQTITRTLTTEERAEKEAREREAASQHVTRQDAVRRDRNLLVRFPNEEAHKRSREAALNDVRKGLKASEARLEQVAAERKPLADETEFYVRKPLPAKLKRALDANDASTDAQRALIQDQRSEMDRINALYDVQLERLKQLWSGAKPGAEGALPTVSAPAAPASSVLRKAAAK